MWTRYTLDFFSFFSLLLLLCTPSFRPGHKFFLIGLSDLRLRVEQLHSIPKHPPTFFKWHIIRLCFAVGLILSTNALKDLSSCNFCCFWFCSFTCFNKDSKVSQFWECFVVILQSFWLSGVAAFKYEYGHHRYYILLQFQRYQMNKKILDDQL